MSKKVFLRFFRVLAFFLVIGLFIGVGFNTAWAQSQNPDKNNTIKPLRHDVGIHGLTVNVHWLSDLHYKENDDMLSYDDSSELEFVYRNVRTMTPRLGVGFQVMTSFFTKGENENFGVGSWGVGPVFRAYPFKTARIQPYMQLNSLFGNNMALGTLSNTTKDFGFRVRLGLKAGVAARITNTLGIFSEIGYDWESDRIFRSDSRNLQINIGVDYYLFN